MNTKLHIFLGTGGVGKTTLSAAWALQHARSGERVALITIDPARRLAQSLGLSELSSSLAPTPISDHLWAMMLEQDATARRIATRFAAPDKLERLLANRYFGVFSSALSGVQEMMAVYEVHEALTCGRFDLIVLDTPPAQHALDFFDVPHRLRVALESPALRWLNQDQTRASSETHEGWRSRVGGFGKQLAMRAMSRITSSSFIDDLFEFLRLFGDVLNQLKSQGKELEELIRSRSSETSLWIVTSPQPISLEAAHQVSRELKMRGYETRGWVVNRTPLMLHEFLKRTHKPSLVAGQRALLDQWSAEALELLKSLERSEKDQAQTQRETLTQASVISELTDVWMRELEASHAGLDALHTIAKEAPELLFVGEVITDERSRGDVSHDIPSDIRATSPLAHLDLIARQLSSSLSAPGMIK